MKQNPKKFASAEQKLRLVQLVEADPQLNSGKFSKSFPINEANKRWLAISHELNSIPGTKKTWKEWRKTWQDRKANVKKKCAFLRRQANLRDGSPPPECPTMADCIILQTLDQESVVVQGVKRKSIKKFASAAQKHRLLRLVEADPHLKSGKFSNSFSKFEARKRWRAISHELNSIPGTKKTWVEWRKTWQDRKANAKKSASLCQKANLRGTPPLESPKLELLEDIVIFHPDDQQTLMGHNDSQELKPTLFDLSQPGTSGQPSALSTNLEVKYSALKSSDVRQMADAQRQLQEGVNSTETLTESLLKQKLEIKKKFYEDFIKLMRMQTQALTDIATALNNAAAMSDVLQ